MARDYDVFEDIRDRLDATGRFARAYVVDRGDDSRWEAGDVPVAAVEPWQWAQTDHWDDPGAPQYRRDVKYTLTLLVADEDPRRRVAQLELLTAAAQNALDGQELAGVTVPGLTKVRRMRKRHDALTAPPYSKYVLVGEFSYWVDGPGAHDESDFA